MKRINYTILGILFVSLILRLFSINFSLPVRFFGDEYIHLANAFKMLSEHTLILDFSYLPNLFAYLLIPFILIYSLLSMLFGVFGNLTELTEYVILHSENTVILLIVIPTEVEGSL